MKLEPLKILKDILKIKLLSNDGQMPSRGSADSAGYDIHSAENVTIPPHSQALIRTMIAMEIPSSHYGQLKSRSGLALKHNIHV